MRKRYADLALMEDILSYSGLDWTIVRPPRLSDGICVSSRRRPRIRRAL
jgi:hypothetical protein